MTRAVLRDLGALDVASPAIIVIGPCAALSVRELDGRDRRVGLSVLPLALKLSGKDVLVIGAGRIGAGKAALLVDAGARVTMIARDVVGRTPARTRRRSSSATTATATCGVTRSSSRRRATPRSTTASSTRPAARTSG